MTQRQKRCRPTMAILILAIAAVCVSQWTLLLRTVSSTEQHQQQQQHHHQRLEPFALESSSLVVDHDGPKNASSLSPLESYNPARFPVLSASISSIFLESTQKSQTTKQKRITTTTLRVGIVTVDPLVGEAMHFLHDGVIGSKYLTLVGNIVSLYGGPNNTHPEIHLQPSDAQIWLIDGARVAKLKREFLTNLLVESINNNNNNNNNDIKIVFFDWSDRFQFQLRNYQQQQQNIWDDKYINVRLAVRSIIQGRNFRNMNGTEQKIMLGRIAPNLPTAGGPMLHCPYAVRSDIVQAIGSLLLGNSSNSSDGGDDGGGANKNEDAQNHDTNTITTTTTRADTFSAKLLQNAVLDPSLPRPMDVLHMWQISFKEGKSKLRNAVSKVVRGLNGTDIVPLGTKTHDDGGATIHHQQQHNRPVLTSIAERGERRKVGRNTVDPAYVQAMLQSKIVIVTQKDDWEDHYRLLEAVVCGPLVLADRMLAPPAGFVHGHTIVFFDTLAQLQEQIVYYLSHEDERRSIARNGWELAMTRHRSFHRIEEILFGRPMTRVELN